MLKAFAALFLIIQITQAFNGDSTWCVPPTESDIPSPGLTLPKQFQATVEANYRSSTENYTSEFDEYYDFDNNRGLLVRYVLQEKARQYFLYDTDEMITVISQVCVVSPLNSTAIGTPFGYEKKDGRAHIFSPINALKLEYTQLAMGLDVIRGITVQTFNSCAYLDELKSTVKIYWAFSDPTLWNSTIHTNVLSESVPVEMRLEGRTDTGETWTQQYQYIKFRPYLDESFEIFETPVGIYCPGRKPTKPLPSIPKHFSFRIEATSTDLGLTTNQAEWYDDENKLVRIDSQTLTQEDVDAFGNTSITEIHDFRRGIRFIIDRKNERCINYTTLDPQGIDADYTNNTKYVKLRPVLELFNFDKNNTFQYQYHGTKKIRDIDCDVWIALRENWPPHPTINRISTWEWYFMSETWKVHNHGEEQKSIPMKLIITHYNQDSKTDQYITNTIVYNYYDYNEEKPEIFSFDLHTCFSDLQTKYLTFTLDTPYSKTVQNKHDFKYKIAHEIAKIAYVLPTRITNLDIFEKNSLTHVYFKMLDKLPITGNVENPVEDISLDDAYSLLSKSVKKGSFNVKINTTVFKASTNSLREVDDVSKKPVESLTIYIAIGAAVGGVLFGVVLTVLIVNTLRKKETDGPVLSMSGILNKNFRE